MTYRVILQRFAVQDLGDAFAWVARRAPATAARWLDRFQDFLQQLDTNAPLCTRARESRKVSLDLRETLYGRRPNVFRVIFVIDGHTVRVLRIRRGQRRSLTIEEINEASEQGEP